MEFLILGPLEVRSGLNTVHVGSSKQRALLGVLLLHPNETVSNARLVDGLWGERPPATAEKLVQGYVHALRKQLGNGVLETRAPGYRLNVDPRSLDLSEFERLTEAARTAPLAQAIELRKRALALWRGSPLADVVLEGPDRHALARLSELRLATQIDQIDAELGLGRDAKLVGELETLTAAHPYQERLTAQLMLALYRSGRQADALEVYRGLRRRLDEELGLQPGQELRALEAAILRQDHALDAPVRADVPSALEGATAAGEPAPIQVSDEKPSHRRTLLRAGAILGLVVVAVSIAALLLLDDPAPIAVAPNSVAVIDIDTNRVEDTVPVGIRPGPVAQGEGAIWVGNLEDRTLSRIDPATREVVKNIQLPATPNAIAVGAGAVWVVSGRLGTLYRVDPAFGAVSDPIYLADRAITFIGGGVAVGHGSVWAVFGDSTLARVDPGTLEGLGSGLASGGPAALVVGYGSIWVANSVDSAVQRFSPLTFQDGPVDEFTVGRMPTGLGAGEGAIWVTSTGDDYVTRLDAALSFNSARPIPVGDGPTAVAVGGGAVWVANTAAGTVSRIDPETSEVVDTIEVGNATSGVAVAGDSVWVAVQAP